MMSYFMATKETIQTAIPESVKKIKDCSESPLNKQKKIDQWNNLAINTHTPWSNTYLQNDTVGFQYVVTVNVNR